MSSDFLVCADLAKIWGINKSERLRKCAFWGIGKNWLQFVLIEKIQDLNFLNLVPIDKTDAKSWNSIFVVWSDSELIALRLVDKGRNNLFQQRPRTTDLGRLRAEGAEPVVPTEAPQQRPGRRQPLQNFYRGIGDRTIFAKIQAFRLRFTIQKQHQPLKKSHLKANLLD